VKDEVTHKQDYALFEYRFKQLQELKEEVQTYRTLLKEDLKSNFVAIPEHVLRHLPNDQYYTKDEVLIELQQEYVKLLKEYNEYKNRSFIQRLLNL
jgi:hypothetical protein